MSEANSKTTMTRKRKMLITALVLGALVVCWLFLTNSGRRAQFMLGGVLVNLGYRMQDHLESYDFEHKEDISPE